MVLGIWAMDSQAKLTPKQASTAAGLPACPMLMTLLGTWEGLGVPILSRAFI